MATDHLESPALRGAQRRRPVRHRGPARPALRPVPPDRRRLPHDQLPHRARPDRPDRGGRQPGRRGPQRTGRPSGSCCRRRRWLQETRRSWCDRGSAERVVRRRTAAAAGCGRPARRSARRPRAARRGRPGRRARTGRAAGRARRGRTAARRRLIACTGVHACSSGGPHIVSVMSVRTSPGLISSTMTPVPSRAAARVSVSRPSPAFDVAVGRPLRPRRCPIPLPRCSTRPEPRATIAGSTAWASRNGPRRLVSTTRHQSSGSASHGSARRRARAGPRCSPAGRPGRGRGSPCPPPRRTWSRRVTSAGTATARADRRTAAHLVADRGRRRRRGRRPSSPHQPRPSAASARAELAADPAAAGTA